MLHSPDSNGKPCEGLLCFLLAKKSDKTKKLGIDQPTGRQVVGNSC